MDDQPNVPRPIQSLQSLLIGTTDVQTFLDDVAVLAVEVVGTDVSCGITTRYAGNLLTVGSSDTRAELLDEQQYRSRGGPCLQALATGRVVESDTATETRWPDYIGTARDHGLQASLSLPMTVSGTTLGAINVYSFDGREVLRPELRRQLGPFVAQAAIALRLVTRQAKDGTLLAQLEEALGSRTVIDQALGIIMAQRRCTATEAFDLLRQQSQNDNLKLRDIATGLVTRTSGQPPVPGRAFEVD